jgi:RNA polymerase sigma factor (sigma-70 family)
MSGSIGGWSQEELLARLRAGDVVALEAIYRAYSEPLSKLGYSLTRSREATQDLVHDLFLAVWERRETLDVQDDLGVYLRSALRHRAYKASRHEAVVRRSEAAALEPDADVPAMGTMAAPDVALEAAEVERAFAVALDTVSERDRRILTMRWGEGLTHEEIALVLGISRARVRAIIAKQQERLRPFFEALRPD